jgi:propanediol dehydratase small subunit
MLRRKGKKGRQRALRLFTIAEADDSDVQRELARINKLHLQARSRLAELEGRRAVSAQFEPMAEKVKEYCTLIRDRLDQLTFEEKREVLEVLQAEFTLEKDGQLRIFLVLPSAAESTYVQHNYTRATCVGIHGAKSYTGRRHIQSDCC